MRGMTPFDCLRATDAMRFFVIGFLTFWTALACWGLMIRHLTFVRGRTEAAWENDAILGVSPGFMFGFAAAAFFLVSVAEFAWGFTR